MFVFGLRYGVTLLRPCRTVQADVPTLFFCMSIYSGDSKVMYTSYNDCSGVCFVLFLLVSVVCVLSCQRWRTGSHIGYRK